MLHLLAVYDLTNYAAFRGLGIGLSFAVAGLILVATFIVYRRSVAQERAALQAGASAAEYAVTAKNAAADTAEDSVIAENDAPTEDSVIAEDETGEAETAATVAALVGDAADTAAENDTAAADTGGSAAIAEAEGRGAEPPPDFIVALAAEMPSEARAAFAETVVRNAGGLVTRVRPVEEYEEEEPFLHDFFRSAAKYKKLLPTAAFETLYEHYCRYIKSDAARTRLNNKLIGAYYARRDDEADALDKCEEFCREDIELNLTVRGVSGARVPSLKRLVLVYAARKKYDEAIALCDRAIGRGLIDAKGAGYEARRGKLAARLEKQKAREERARIKLAKAEIAARQREAAQNER